MSSVSTVRKETQRRRKNQHGLTLVELIVAFTILMTLTAMAVPMAQYKVRREKERDLRIALSEMRKAIDKYKDMADAGQLGQTKIGTENYPETLEILVNGVELAQSADGKKIRFLRRIPKDPFTNTYDWGLRATQDDPKSMSWGGDNVFDVYSKTMDKAADGTPYSEW
jgi:general secretion pathway protein G